MTDTYPDCLRAYVAHNAISSREASRATGDWLSAECPLCGSSDGFGIALKPATRDGKQYDAGMFNCFKCLAGGNVYSFLTRLHEESFAATRDWSPLAADRSLPADLLKEYGVAQHLLRPGEWLIPIRGEKGEICNLCRYDPTAKAEGRTALLTTPGCKIIHPYRVETLGEPPPGNTNKKSLAKLRLEYPLAILEGYWDTMAWDHVIRTIGHRSEYDIIGMLGANTFRKDWMRHLHNRHVVVLLDYDAPHPVGNNGKVVQAGDEGLRKLIRIVQETKDYAPASLKVMEWKRNA